MKKKSKKKKLILYVSQINFILKIKKPYVKYFKEQKRKILKNIDLFVYRIIIV